MTTSFLFVAAPDSGSDGAHQKARSLLEHYFPDSHFESATTAQFHTDPSICSAFDLVLTRDARIEQEAKLSGVDTILWKEESDLSGRLDAFVQLRRYQRRFPLDVEGLRLLEVLGSTQDAVIYKAIDTAGTSYAVKRYKYHLESIPEQSVRTFIDTLETQRGLKHAGLVKIFSGGMNQQAFYLVMEYLGNGTLRDSLTECGRLPLEHALQWFEEIVKALRHVHHAGLIHRNLKADNIMLRDDGTLALSDYGVSKHVLLDFGLIRADEIHCSPYYVSPEQVLENRCSVQSDLYSLGIILFELLTGEKPYHSRQVYQLLTQHVIAPIPALPDQLARYQPLLNNLLAKDPKERFASTDEVLASFRLLSF